MSANVEASWSVSLLVECPDEECGHMMDLDGSSQLERKEIHALESRDNVELECTECGKKFMADLVW